MARGINKVILVGNLGADPETRYTGSGSAITTIKIATSEAWKDKQTGENQERTEWHRVKFFGRLAEVAGEYLKKGRQVYIEGSLRTDKYTDKDGVERYTTDVIASEMQMLGSGNGSEEGSDRRQRSDSGNHGSRERSERTGNGGGGHAGQRRDSNAGERSAGGRGEPSRAGGYGNRNNDGPRRSPAPQWPDDESGPIPF